VEKREKGTKSKRTNEKNVYARTVTKRNSDNMSLPDAAILVLAMSDDPLSQTRSSREDRFLAGNV